MKENKYPNCPICDYFCPYCLASGECIIDNPIEECDDFFYNELKDLYEEHFLKKA